MNRILRFDEFKQTDELNEGWKTNLLVGLLSVLGVNTIGAGKAQAHKVPQQPRITTHTHNLNTAKSFIQQGWTLDSTQVDTLYQEVVNKNPETEVIVSRLKFDKNQYFESGKFTLSQEVKDDIQSEFNNISNENGVITDIVVTSSTDKQGLTVNLQNQLKKMGFTGDNQGLSKARNQAISNFLKGELNVNDTLITPQENFEQGSGEIDQSARFVSLDIYYIINIVKEIPGQEPTKKINTTYHLSKQPTSKHQHIRGGNKEVKKLGPVKNFTDRHAYKCPRFK